MGPAALARRRGRRRDCALKPKSGLRVTLFGLLVGRNCASWTRDGVCSPQARRPMRPPPGGLSLSASLHLEVATSAESAFEVALMVMASVHVLRMAALPSKDAICAPSAAPAPNHLLPVRAAARRRARARRDAVLLPDKPDHEQQGGRVRREVAAAAAAAAEKKTETKKATKEKKATKKKKAERQKDKETAKTRRTYFSALTDLHSSRSVERHAHTLGV